MLKRISQYRNILLIILTFCVFFYIFDKYIIILII